VKAVSGGAEFEKEKFKQVLHYIIHQCGSLEHFGKVVSYKLLYFADFDYYELFEEKLTGETYRKFDLGPVPVHFEQAIQELKEEGKVEMFELERGQYKQHRFISLKEPSLNLLTGDEIEFIEKDIVRYCHMNASRISAFSHGDIPYKATNDNEVIDYELVFYRDPLFSVREYEDGT
jgi:uncharacterized phage-associated protein